MKKNMKRVVTLVLCAVMTLGLLAVSASAENSGLTTNDNVVTSKTVTPNSDGTYTVTLDAYATGAEKIEIKKVAVPLDIVIALDVSGETKNKIVVADREKSLDSIDSEYGKNASSTTDTSDPDLVYELDDTIYKDDGSLDWNSLGSYHWQAMKYAEDHWWYMGWFLQSGNWRHIKQAWDTAGKDIRVKKIDAEKMAAMKFINSILTNANDPENDGVQYRVSVVKYGGTLTDAIGNATYDGNKNYSQIVIEPTVVSNDTIGTFKNAIYSTTTITAGGDANLANGMTKVSDALTMMSDSSAQKVVVVISGGSLDGDASAAVSTAADLKANEAAIYTFCIDDAKDAIPAQSTLNSMATSGSCVVTTQSSQLDAQLGSLFDKVDKEFSEGGSAIDLDASTVLQDVVTEYFDIVPGSASAHSASTSDGGTTWTDNDDSYTVNVSGRTVTATGFSYKDNWVGTTNGEYHAGKKLVLTFQIKPRDGFLGGNGVPTNVTADCGIYSPNTSGTMTLVENFPEPDPVDVPLKTLTIIPADKNVYLGNSIPFADLTAGAKVYINYGTTSQEELDLSDQTNFGLEAWQGEFIDSIEITGAKIWGAKYTNDFNTPKEVSVKEDSEYYFKYTIKKKNGYSTTNDTANVANTKKIFLYTPNLTYDNETIYLGNDPKLEPNSTVWKHGDTVAVPANMIGTVPTLSDFTYDKSDFTTCQENVTLTELKINGAKYISTYDPGSFTANSFAVHVLKPTLSASDVTIYQGQSQTLADCISGANDAWTDHNSGHTAGTPSSSKPTISYTFDQADTSITPDSCTTVTITAATANGKSVMDCLNQNSFTVHVLKPTFALTVTDLWADVGVTVDLSKALSGTVSNSWAYTGSCTSGHTKTEFEDAPSLGTLTVNYSEDSHTMDEADVTTEPTFTVTGVSYGSKQATVASGDVEVAYPANNCITLHVNTFDLTINKTWTGAVCYKQDAIFKVSRQGSSEVLKVVIPQDKNSVTVAGLLCGQSYTVIEDTNWSWRWNSSTSNNPTTQGRPHTHTTEIVNEEPADCTVIMTFENTLDKDKTQWLSGTAYAHNVYSGGGWSQVTESPVKKAVRALLGN